MSRQLQDKSRGNIIPNSNTSSLLHFELSSSHSHHSSERYQPSYFDKYKHPRFQISSAFRLCQPLTNNYQLLNSKKTPIPRKHRGNYRKYSISQKEEAVRQILEGVNAKEISEKYCIPRRNLLRWKKNGCERKEGGGRPTDGEMQFTLYTKIDNKKLLNEKDIRAEARKLSKMADFKASKGWYSKFSRRYNQWKKQQRERTLKIFGSVEGLQNEMFLLPEASLDSEFQSSAQKQQSSAKLDQ